ncbi:DNA topology modulation protein [Paenibacillus sp. FSL R5-0912]|uniref:DNA topology modulation protein n=1 Tax=Paenibacillus sp. FSL R5-0912 TaxID=1536771 RepID=UPI0004F791F7|nr:DNA topology modulation protein [Paenibacillus sp. FSL R5-0912]AIQ42215.1 ATPase AAA [Paenibacillus sp. FSL R5-0912]
MNRILILGSGGSGKSTLARQVGGLLHLPVVHLDALFWNPDWIPTPDEEWDGLVRQYTEQEQWIIDGNYSKTMDMRIRRADVIIFLDLPRLLCMYRIVKRRLMYHNQTRPDMNEGCPEKLDFAFVKWVWSYKTRSRDNTIARLRQAGAHQQVITVTSRRQVKALIRSFADAGPVG